MMYIEAVTVSIHFGDYLAVTLPRNLRAFDRIIVVTSPDDEETQEICRRLAVEYVVTEKHRDEGGFNKGKAINEGMRHFHFTDWLCHIDADIVIPKPFREYLPRLVVDRYRSGIIFGCQRKMCESYQAWRRFLETGSLKHLRLDNIRTDNHWPVGFFQMWHADDHQWYPEDVPLARNSDIGFAKKFKGRCHSEQSVIHLSADAWVRGRDDEGRRSKRWGAEDASAVSG